MIELLLEGKLPIVADGQMELPKEPPFIVLTPDPAAILTVQLEPESPRCIRLFDAWYFSEGSLDVVAHDGEGAWIRAAMLCTGLERHAGIQTTRDWSEPLRRVADRGQSALYRPSPRYQPISRPVHRYTLVAQRYAFVPPLTRAPHDQHSSDQGWRS